MVPKDLLHEQDTFAQWQALWQDRPEKVAERLNQRLEQLPDTWRRAILAHVPTPKALAASVASAEGPLAGVPFMVKDLFDMAGIPTLAGASFLDQVRKTPVATSPLVEELYRLGMVYAGKVQLNEFAFGASGENPHYGDCEHPRVPGALTGGSSSGSAWAVATGLVPFALGTDTAGSVRIPAAFCGLYGIKLVPDSWAHDGVFPLSPSFDTAGWLTAYRQDMQVSCRHLLGKAETSHVKGIFLPSAAETVEPELAERTQQLVRYLELEQDAETTAWFQREWEGCEAAFNVIRSLEAFEVHKEWLDVMKDHYGEVVWQRIDRGRIRDDEALEKAWVKRAAMRAVFEELFARYDVIAMPVSHMASPDRGMLDEGFRRQLLSHTLPASLCGLPALSVPLNLEDGRSGGLQLIFPPAELGMADAICGVLRDWEA
ncbi:MAG: amidase [Verrucomicrobiota bacterium]